jgi:hypothetical protein
MNLAPEDKQVPCAHPCGSIEALDTGAADVPLQLRFGFAGMHGGLDPFIRNWQDFTSFLPKGSTMPYPAVRDQHCLTRPSR